ncbi:MAG: hypothetical protein ACRD0K_19375 [Egibacteraceae bacterium]
MPTDVVSDFFRAEYDRLMEAIADLSDDAQQRVRQAAAYRDPRFPQKRAVSIPGWDDVFHVVPAAKATALERDAHYEARRRGQPSPLSEELQASIERRGRRARAMSASAAPEYAKAWGQGLTALDNVQDFLTTMATSGRLMLVPAERLLNRLGTLPSETALREAAERGAYLEAARRLRAGELITTTVLAEARGLARQEASRQLARGAFHLGARTVGRVIPVLGWVLTAADLIRLMTLLGLAAFPFYTAMCAGATAALAAGVPALLASKALKLKAGRLGLQNPFGRKARLQRSRTIRSWKPTYYNLIEAAQTTDQLFGVGVSLGALMGLVTDSAFGIEQRARGLDVEVNTQPFADSLHRLFAPGMRTIPTPALQDHRAAAGVLVGGATINRTQDVFSIEEHAEALVAEAAAWDFLSPVIEAPAMVEALNLALELDWAPPAWRQRDTARAIAAEGIPFAGGDLWPFPDAPARVSGEQLMRERPAEITQALAELLMPRRNEVTGAFLGAVVARITDRTTIAFAGTTDAFAYEFSPLTQTLESLALQNRWPSIDAGEEAMQAYFTDLEIWLSDRRARSIPLPVLEDRARAHGVTLIKMLDPDAPWPEALVIESDAGT